MFFSPCLVRLTVALPLAAAGSTIASADTIPRWDISEVCASSDLGARCPRVESEYRRAVFNRWEALPLDDRTTCEKLVNVPGQRSYRRLLSCLETKAYEAIEDAPIADDGHDG